MVKYNNAKYSFEGKRLDKFLTDVLKDLSRSQVQKIIKAGEVKVNGSNKKSSYLLSERDVIDFKKTKKKIELLKPEKVDIPLLYEDEDVLVVNKPSGMIVHPVDGSRSGAGTLVSAILDKIERDEFEGLRPGIVHRIDKDTSGALIVARNKKSYEDLVQQFKDRKVNKVYLALVCGPLKHPEGIIESPIGREVVNRKRMRVAHEKDGKMAVSVYRTLKTFDLTKSKYPCALLEVKIKTGRTHQIRVHMAALGNPVIGDTTYGNRKVNAFFKETFGLERQFLHAHKLGFISPGIKKKVSVQADLPSDLENVITLLS